MHLVLCECKVSHDGASCMLLQAHSAQYIQQGKQYIYTQGLGSIPCCIPCIQYLLRQGKKQPSLITMSDAESACEPNKSC